MTFPILRGLVKEIREHMPTNTNGMASSSQRPSTTPGAVTSTAASAHSTNVNAVADPYAYVYLEKLISGGLDILKSIVLLCTQEARAQLLYTSSLFDPVHEFLIYTNRYMHGLVAEGLVDEGVTFLLSKPSYLVVFIANLHVAALDACFAFAECSQLRSTILSSVASSTLEDSIGIILSLSNLLMNNKNSEVDTGRSDGVQSQMTGSNTKTPQRVYRELGRYLSDNFTKFDAQIDKLLNQTVSMTDCAVS
jgi:hypothetical protein